MSAAAAGAAGLGAAALLLVAAALATARRPEHPPPDRDGYLDRWSLLHGGYEARRSTVVRCWLTLGLRLSRPLARAGVQPDAVTAGSLWLALAVPLTASAGGRWPVLAGCLLAASGLLDTLDGCVAVLQDRTSRWGYLLDSLVDRVSEVAYLVAVVAVGVPGPLAAAVGTGFFLLEYTRARAGNATGDDVGTVTLAERPVRVLVLAGSLGAAGLLGGSAATTGTAVMAGLTAIALAQLVTAVRRQLLATSGLTLPAGG